MKTSIYQFATKNFIEENVELFVKRFTILCERGEQAGYVFSEVLANITVKDEEAIHNVIQNFLNERYKENPYTLTEITEIFIQNRREIGIKIKYATPEGKTYSDTYFYDVKKFGDAIECEFI